jgi:hypothetical protein
MAFEPGLPRAALVKPFAALADETAHRRRFRAATMSQICVAKKTIVSSSSRIFSGPEGFMKRPAGSPRPCLAGTVAGKTPVTDLEERLYGVLATLEECQVALALSGDRDTAQLVSVAILELRIKLNRIEDAELKALCDAVLRDVGASEAPPHPKPHEGQRGRAPVLLKLVK